MVYTIGASLVASGEWHKREGIQDTNRETPERVRNTRHESWEVGKETRGLEREWNEERSQRGDVRAIRGSGDCQNRKEKGKKRVILSQNAECECDQCNSNTSVGTCCWAYCAIYSSNFTCCWAWRAARSWCDIAPGLEKCKIFRAEFGPMWLPLSFLVSTPFWPKTLLYSLMEPALLPLKVHSITFCNPLIAWPQHLDIASNSD